MPDRSLKVIPEPEPNTRVVLATESADIVLLTGLGDNNLLCGQCDVMLVRGVGEVLTNVVILCAGCGSYNDSVDPQLLTHYPNSEKFSRMLG
jgi:hypothetical protein